jgi:hypothetical protein
MVGAAHYTRANEGQLTIIGTQLRLWAMNRDLDQYLYGVPAPVSNIQGGFGVLGGAIEVRKAISWR